MNAYHILWSIWLGAFFVIEFAALILHRGQGDTLSECVWKVFDIVGRSHSMWRLRRFVLLAFVTWLAVHFMTGGWV